MNACRVDARLPPGTTQIEDVVGKHIVLSPPPSSDPNQPLNWSTWRKSLHMTVLSFYALMIFAILCVPPPLWQQMNEELGISYDDLNNAYATSQGTLALGCIIFVPLGLRFGRRPVYILTALIMLASAIWFARIETRGDLFGANVICGLAGSVNEALFQVTVADLFFVHQRGTMNGVFIVVVFLGNYLGPVAAGYVAVSQGWRWVYWYCTAFMALSTVTVIVCLEESKFASPPIRGQSVAYQDTHGESSDSEKDVKNHASSPSIPIGVGDLPNTGPIRQTEINTSIPMKSYWQRHALLTFDKDDERSTNLLQHVYQPFLILGQFPAMMFAALQWGWVIGMLVVLAVVQADLYPLPPYNFSAAGVGLQNLPPAIGAILGSAFGGPLNDYFILQVAKRKGGIYEPESRLMLFLVPGLCMTVGTLLFGLTIARGMPWIVNAVGAGFIGFSLGGCGDMALTYVQDSYQNILGDALTGVVFVRNALATVLIFAVPPWMSGMGTYNMFVLIGVLAVLVAFTSVPMIIWGRKWRVQLAGKYEHYATRQY